MEISTGFKFLKQAMNTKLRLLANVCTKQSESQVCLVMLGLSVNVVQLSVLLEMAWKEKEHTFSPIFAN